MPRRKNTDIMTAPLTKSETEEPQMSKLDLAIKLAKEIQNKKSSKKEIIEDEDTDDDDVEYVIQTAPKARKVHEVISVAPVVEPVEIPTPTPIPVVKKPRVKKEKPQPQPQQPLIQVQPPASYNYEKIRYLEQENERLKNSLKFNGLSRLQNFSNSMKIKF
jgi:hypothetical protein